MSRNVYPPGTRRIAEYLDLAVAWAELLIWSGLALFLFWCSTVLVFCI